MEPRREPVLDGLRAVAALMVLLYHLHLLGMAGGWLGVDVFFALSGWLITRALLTEIGRTGRLRLGDFYLRRAARLYPALVVCGVAFVVLAIVQDRNVALAKISALLALTYTTDLWMWLTHGPAGPLTHAWSLAVEEQFYLLWPLVLLAVRGRAARVTVVAALAAGSLGLMATSSGRMGGCPAGYFLPHTRAWDCWREPSSP